MQYNNAPFNGQQLFSPGIGSVIGRPAFGNYNPAYFQKQLIEQYKNVNIGNTKLGLPGEGLKRAIHFYADYGGCGLWRMSWPELLLNGYGKAIVNGLTQMIVDHTFYRGISAVKVQRQATPEQLKFIQFLKTIQPEYGFKIVYEVDDVVFAEDIPLYNKSRDAFTSPEIIDSIYKIISLCDEMCVVSPYMRDYYKRKLGKEEISVIPNYAPKFWLHDLYNPSKVERSLVKNKKRPIIGYLGSGTHFDVANVTGQKDDFGHVIDAVIKTRKKYQWVFMGSFPLQLLPFIQRQEIIHVPWANIYNYPRVFSTLDINAVVAPLERNEFNRSKSDIKMIEAGALGIPGVFQDLEPYENAKYKFTDGDSMILQLDTLLRDRSSYMKYSREMRSIAEKRWLDDHLDEHVEMLFKKYNEPREALSKSGYNVF